MYDGIAQFLQCPHDWCMAPSAAKNQTVSSVVSAAGNTSVIVSGGFQDAPGIQYTIKFEQGNSTQDLKFSLDINALNSSMPYVMASLRIQADEKEAFWGFGEQFTYLNQRGKMLRLLNMEQGIFRGQQPESAALNVNTPGTAGDWWTTYIALPQYISSSNRSVYFENYEPFVFDLTPTDHIVANGNSTHLVGHILAGASPGALLTEYTRYSGRMEPLPAWIGDGAIVHAQGGSAKVTPVLDKMLAANVSLAALWIEDWSGAFTDSFTGSVQVAYNWVLDRTHYPTWDDIVDAAAAVKARVMVYVNPFLIWTPTVAEGGNATRNLFDEAYSLGYLVGFSNGSYYGPYYSVLITRIGCMIDMSNPAAVAWYKQVLATEVFTNARASGYMADFGEWLPYRHTAAPHTQDVIIHSGGDPQAFHNEYTDIWSGLHKSAVQEWEASIPQNSTAPVNADPVTFVRTGYLKAPGNAQLFWLGDQTVLWDNHDGIQSALTGLLSGGLSGFSINHGDIGGYAGNGFAALGFLKICRTKNIIVRWTEMNAFSPVLRTHLGNAPGSNFQIDSDGDTLAHFARFSHLFAYLAEYRQGLMKEAQAQGWPLVRPMFFHYVSDANTHDLHTQFMFGENLLVAPVLSSTVYAKRTKPIIGQVIYVYAELKVYLPAGNWTRLWKEKTPYVSQGEYVKVKVKVGEPAVFYPTGWAYGEQLSSFVHDELDKNFPRANLTSVYINECPKRL